MQINDHESLGASLYLLGKLASDTKEIVDDLMREDFQ